MKQLMKNSLMIVTFLAMALLFSTAQAGYIWSVQSNGSFTATVSADAKFVGVGVGTAWSRTFYLYDAGESSSRHTSKGYKVYSVHPFEGGKVNTAFHGCSEDQVVEMQYKIDKGVKFTIPLDWLPEWAKQLPEEKRTVTFPLTTQQHINPASGQTFYCISKIQDGR